MAPQVPLAAPLDDRVRHRDRERRLVRPAVDLHSDRPLVERAAHLVPPAPPSRCAEPHLMAPHPLRPAPSLLLDLYAAAVCARDGCTRLQHQLIITVLFTPTPRIGHRSCCDPVPNLAGARHLARTEPDGGDGIPR
jgi:hypothetical protein